MVSLESRAWYLFITECFQMSRFKTVLALLPWTLVVPMIVAAPHPHYDDGGAVNWKPTWLAALQAARTTGKPIFVEAGIEN